MLDTDVFQYVKARDNAEAWHWCVFQYEDWLMCTSKQYVYLCETSRGLPPHQYVQPIWIIDHVYRDGLCLLWRDSAKVWKYVILRYIVHNSVVICESKVCTQSRARRRWCTMLTCACLVNEKHDYAIEHVHVLLMPQMKSDLVRWHSECINLRTIFIAHKFEIKWAQWCIAVNKHMSLCNVARSLWSRSYSTRWNWMYLPAMLNSNGIRIRDETRTMIWLIEWNTHMCKFVHTKQDFATSWYWMLCV